MLKKLLLLFVLFFFNSLIHAQNPSIGFILSAEDLYNDSEIYNGNRTLFFSIKNTGDETLTNISIVDNTNVIINSYTLCENNYNSFSCPDLSSETLYPNEIITMTVIIENNYNCYNDIQFQVTATASSNTEVTDFSDHYSYYYNNYTFIEMNQSNTIFEISETYLDLNNNNIVDLGDAIEYTINSSTYTFGALFPNDQFTLNPTNLYNNEAVTVSSTTNYIGNPVTAMYYLNETDIAIGYAYYQLDLDYDAYDYCNYVDIYQYSSCFNCPTPSGCNDCIKTNLTDMLPNKISGQVSFNANNDDCGTGIPFPNRKVKATTSGANFSSFTNQLGEYSIYIPNINTYNTTASINLNSEFTANPANYSITSSGSNETYAADFCVSSSDNYTDLKVIIIPQSNAVPGFNSSYIVKLYNQGSTNLSGTVTLTYNDTQATLFEQTPISDANTSNSLTWNYNNLLPFSYTDYFVGFTISIPPIVVSDDILTFTATTTQNSTDSNPINNQYTLNQIAVNSFDPNDKTILEGAYITQEQSDGYLHFLTRFQNEGTAAATNIVITETLDQYIEHNTFEPVAASHNTNVQLNGSNQLTYTFENINLPHADANEPASHGWILYKAKLKSWFSNSNIVRSKSNIYFDFNPAIITNEATAQIGVLSTSEASKKSFKLFPNPVTNQLHITTQNNNPYTINILDINGKTIFKNTNTNNKTIEVSSFASGIYIVRITNNNSVQNYKFIKN
ncbi:T9SS type A sorting domain-containing protein [Oceanihabitans sp. 2_MG-2023]|uniref:T9SS type A sorting domain-containing protein n=1 Tax=Oceanihabitans sp. 2_MG-2023 TaxID=3062661 RepID=UPI0026E3C1DF|nr:T9SS type A sorting domain-containing protein [Oceanihabitans sp. 2_MG-2023]MDO6598139.1 T9SS type A sorting domain-containing protein [Oceanihabitans sp. 2_MG-2023]